MLKGINVSRTGIVRVLRSVVEKKTKKLCFSRISCSTNGNYDFFRLSINGFQNNIPRKQEILFFCIWSLSIFK